MSDALNMLIFKISTAGQLSYVAGDGQSGTPDTNVPATASPIGRLESIDVDAGGNLYYVDLDNHRVAKVTPGGSWSFIGGSGEAGLPDHGSPALQSKIPEVWGLSVNPAGTSLFLALPYHFQIARIGMAPTAPQNLTASATATSATLGFGAPADQGDSVITGYEVSTDDGATWASIATSGSGSSLSATVTGLGTGTTYTVRVRAVNANGLGTPSASTQVTPQADPTPAAPSAPRDLTATAGIRSATLTFLPPATPGHPAVSGYQAFMDGGIAEPLTTTSGTGGKLEATISDLTPGTTVSIEVVAVNATGVSDPAGPVTVVPNGLPGAPTSLVGTGGDGSVTVTFDLPPDPGHPAISG